MKKFVAFLCLIAFVARGETPSPCYWSGQLTKCFPTTGIYLDNSRSLQLGTNDSTHYVELKAANGVPTNYSLIFPTTQGSGGQVLSTDGITGALSWITPVSSTVLNGRFAALPTKVAPDVASTANLGTLSGSQTVDGTDTTFLSLVLLKNQTDNTKNGIWVPGPGAWTRSTDMPDNTSSTLGAIVPILGSGTTNPYTIWFSQADGSGATPFVQIPTTNSSAIIGTNRVMQSGGGYIKEAAAITASRALASDSNGIPVASTVTTTELQRLSGIGSTAVGISDSQVLTNKTISGASNTLTVRAASDITGQLPVANGGTSLAAGTSGGIPYFSGTTSMASSGALTANAVVIGGGAGTTPSVVANNSTGTNKFLTQSSSAAPAWSTIAAADVPAASSSAAGSVSYEDNGTFSATFSGAFTSNQTVTVRYSRVGKIVTLHFPAKTAACSSASSLSAAASTVPAALTIPVETDKPVFVADASANQTSPGDASFSSDGSITITKNYLTTTFTATGNCGWTHFDVVYTVF